MSTRKTLGVIGGLGPAASADFYAKLIERSPATSDQDHLHVIINSYPQVPNRNEAIAGTGPNPGPALAKSAKALEAAGAEVLVMVCNAAHAFQADIEAAVSIPFISIIDETRNYTLKHFPNIDTVGLLAASACLDAKLYHQAFSRGGVGVLALEPAQQQAFMELLYRIKAGDTGKSAQEQMQGFAERLIDKGAKLIVAGCTEVPLVLHEGMISVPLVGSSDVLVGSSIAIGLGEREP